MPNINDFKILKKICLNRFNVIKNINSEITNDYQKEKIGFYHFILENITGAIENDIGSYTIIDTEYNKIINSIHVDDLGMDAIFINERNNDENEIMLFNFKYRKEYKSDKNMEETTISRSTKFLEYINSENKINDANNKFVIDQVNKIIDLLNDNKICHITLFMVSNEAKGFHTASNPYIDLLCKNYNMELVEISLNEIANFYNDKRKDYQCKFILNQQEFLSFECDSLTTQKSYIIKLPLIELIRITSSDKVFRDNYRNECDSAIKNLKLDYIFLYDNIRGFLGEGKFNKNILNTLYETPQLFFMYNNGITITCEDIKCESINSKKKYIFTLSNFQIVNGGQTLRTLFNFLSKCSEQEIENLRDGNILIRIFTVEDDLRNSISEYTNSQNSIDPSNLKSVDSVQIQLEKYLQEEHILYARKIGDIGDINFPYSYRITMELLAQLLYSKIGYPDRASNQKSRLFSVYYDEIYKNENNFSMENCLEVIRNKIEIDSIYNKLNIKNYNQKTFYIIYISSKTQLTLEESIKKLEELINSFETESESTDARKLIKSSFKTHVNNELNIKIQ